MREQLGNRPRRFCCTRVTPSTGCGVGWVSSWSIPPRSTWQTWDAPVALELDQLDPSTLDDARLAEAFTSAAGLRDDARTARLASELLVRRPALLNSLDLTSVVAPLVRLAIARDDPIGGRRLAETGEIDQHRQYRQNTRYLARAGVCTGRPAGPGHGCLRAPDQSHAPDAGLALDAGEMMLDNGHLDQARVLLRIAGDTAAREHRPWIVRRVRQLLDRIP